MFRAILKSDDGDQDSVKRQRRKSSKKCVKTKLKEVLIAARCPDDEDFSMWDCEVCLYSIRLELRLNFGIIPRSENMS